MLCKEIENIKDSMQGYLASVSCKSVSDKLNACAHIFSMIEKNPENSQELFEHFLSTAKSIEGRGEAKIDVIYTDKEREALKKKYGTLINETLELLLKRNLDEHDFYTQLWNNIFCTTAFQEKDSKVFALYYIWIDARIPYFKLEAGLQMDNSEFVQRTQNLNSNLALAKAQFILKTNYFSQKTARASVLLSLIDSLKEKEEDRIVLMAHVLDLADSSKYIEERIKQLSDKLSAVEKKIRQLSDKPLAEGAEGIE